MQSFIVKGRARLVQVPLNISAYSNGEVTLSLMLPETARALVVGINVDKQDALWDHQAWSLLHNEYEAIGRAQNNNGTERGVPLGHVVVAPGLTDSPAGLSWRSRLWPGPVEVEGLGCCHGVAAIPVRGGLPFILTARRLYGATAIAQASALMLLLEDGQAIDRICDGREKYFGRPLWQACGLLYAAGAASQLDAVHEVRFKRYDGFASRIRQFFGTGYDNNGGTLAVDGDYVRACGVGIEGYGRELLAPDWANKPLPVESFAPALLQDFTAHLDPALRVPDSSGLTLNGKKLATTTNAAELLMSAYCTLEVA